MDSAVCSCTLVEYHMISVCDGVSNLSRVSPTQADRVRRMKGVLHTLEDAAQAEEGLEHASADTITSKYGGSPHSHKHTYLVPISFVHLLLLPTNA